MPSIHAVMQYSGLNYEEALSLPTDTFLLMLKNYYVNKLRETEEGRQYLADCERYTITTPDTDSLFTLQQQLSRK